MNWFCNLIHDWWHARKLEDMRVGAAYTYLCSGEMSAMELRAKLKKLWFGKRMTTTQWHAVMFRLRDEQGVLTEEWWVQETPYMRSLSRFYRLRSLTGGER